MNRFFKPIKYLGILTVVIVISVLIVGGAERSFHNLIHGVQEATPQQ